MTQAVPIALLSALVLAVPVRGQRHPSLDIEDGYRIALSDFSEGAWVDAVGKVLYLERESSLHCLQAVELYTASQLIRTQPESLLIQTFLRVAARQAHYTTLTERTELFAFERAAISTVRKLGLLYLDSSSEPEARSLLAGFYTYLAQGIASLRSRERVGTAAELLESAVELDGSHRAARLSLVVALELLGRPAQAAEHLERLLELSPDDPRFLVRRAVLTVKAGRALLGEQLLEELTSSGPTWSRELATQELAGLMASQGRETEAEALLRRALEELPSEKIRLQLAAQIDPRWSESWAVLEPWLAEPPREAEPSGRWVYENGAGDEIDTLRGELGAAVADRSASLKIALERVPTPHDRQRKKLAACR
jgi:tetratricopeptide (TPR) repeat protein